MSHFSQAMTSSYHGGGEEMVGDGEGEAKQPVHKRPVHPLPKKHLLKLCGLKGLEPTSLLN